MNVHHFHLKLLGKEQGKTPKQFWLQDQHKALYAAYAENDLRGYSTSEFDEDLFTATFVLALAMSETIEPVYFAAPTQHIKWVVEQMERVAGHILRARKGKGKEDEEGRRVLRQTFQLVTATSKIFDLEEPQKWVMFGFKNEDVLPAWARNRLLDLAVAGSATSAVAAAIDSARQPAVPEVPTLAQAVDSPKPPAVPEVPTLAKDVPAMDESATTAPAMPRESAYGDTWPVPRPLAEAYGPTFPVEALSPWHRKYVEELARQARTPLDAPAVSTLGALGAAGARTAVITVQDGESHPTNQWVIVVSPSGEGRTPCQAAVRSPFDAVQRHLRAQAHATAMSAETRRRVALAQVRALENEAARLDDGEEREALIQEAVAARAAADGLRPRTPTLTTGDPTQAGVVRLMAENNGRILLISDEGDQVFSRVQQSSPQGAEDIEAMLQAHSGAPIERHRWTGAGTVVPSSALSMILGIQPGPFAKVMGVRPYHDKGFLGRFLMAVLPPRSGSRQQVRSAISAAVRAEYHERVRRLLMRPVIDPTPELGLSPGAFDLFMAFGAEIDGELASGELSCAPAWGNKLWGATARIAATLHLADQALSDEVDPTVAIDTMERAILIARYFRAHALVAYKHAVQSAADEHVRLVLAWVTNGRRERFHHAAAVKGMWPRLDGKEVAHALDRLVEDNYLRVHNTPRRAGTGRPPSATYEVNPRLYR